MMDATTHLSNFMRFPIGKYQEICEAVNTLHYYTAHHKICEMFPEISNDLIKSITTHEIVRLVKKRHHTVIQPSNLHRMTEFLHQNYCKESMKNPLLELSRMNKFSPYLIAKNVTFEYLVKKLGLNSHEAQKIVSSMTNNKVHSFDPYLTRIFTECVNSDGIFDPISSRQRGVGAKLYEEEIEETLKSNSIYCENQQKLTAKGFLKTPDFLLPAPIAVGNFIVNWIECKSYFCSLNDFKMMGTQIESYFNHFGSGLISFSLGFLEGLPVDSNKFMLYQRLPESFTKLESLLDEEINVLYNN